MKAMLLLDPDRHADQVALVSERARVLLESGERLWVDMNERLVDRFVDAGIHVQPQEGMDLIELPALVFDPAQREPQVPAGLAASPATGDRPAYHLVQFIVPPEPEWVQALEEVGGDFVGDLRSHAAAFKFTAAQAAAARESTGVTWVGPYHPAYAMSHELAGREEPFDAASLATARPDAAMFESTLEGALRVVFFADAETSGMRAAVTAAGAEVVGDTGEALLVNCSAANLPALLRVQGVRAIEPHRPPRIENQRAGVIIGANQVRNFGSVDFLVNLDGAGEVVGVFDTGLDNGAVPTAHTDFNMAGLATSRVIRIDNLNPTAAGNAQDVNGHGTHVAGSIAGDGRNALPVVNPLNSVPRGVAPGCNLIFTSVNNFTLPAPPAPQPLDFSQSLIAFSNHYAAGARIHSNSWGAIGPNTYTNGTGSLDHFAWFHPDSVLLFAAGNDEADLNNDGRFDQNFLGPEVTGKNILVIGASENVTSVDGDARNYQTRTRPCNRYGTLGASPVRIAANSAAAFSGSDVAQDVAMFSSRGQVRNSLRAGHRRVKPDLVAPGTNILSTRSAAMPITPTIGQVCPPIVNPPGIPNPRLANTAPQASYFVISGTSMATPIAAGACALVRQFYRQRYGQLRRPELVHALTDLIDLPCAIALGNRRVVLWVQRDAVAARNDLAAAVYDSAALPQGAIVTMASGVGDQPAPVLALHDTATLLLWRDAGAALKLAAFDAALQPLAGFGTAGVAPVAAATRTEPERRHGIAVHGDEAGIVWFRAGSDDLLFQRFNAVTGAAIDGAPVVLGQASATSNHPFVLYNGARWVVCWSRWNGATSTLHMRFVANDGHAEGAQPFTLLTQAAAIGAPHLAWDASQSRFMIAFVSALLASRGVNVLRVDAAGAAFGAAGVAVPLAFADSRSPRVDRHPDGGFVLLWEDTLQGSFDLYLSFLDAAGVPGAVHRLQISDTPEAISGFSAVVDANGVVPIWQSKDEAHADLRGVYLLGVTKYGVFAAQQDASTPLLDQQVYTRQTLLRQGFTDRPATAMAWAGGDFYLLRMAGSEFLADIELVHTQADGVLDTNFGLTGARRIDQWLPFTALSMAWTGSLLAAGASLGNETRLYLVQPDGRLVPNFGSNGILDLVEAAAEPVFMQVATRGSGAGLLIHVAYGGWSPDDLHHLRYSVRNARGGVVGAGTVAPMDLARIGGTAKHGWFHLVLSDVPAHCVAAWHVPDAGRSQVKVQRFRLNGTPQAGHATPIALSSAAGEAMNPVIAPRPVQFAPGFPVNAADLSNSRRREYGAAWQHQPVGANWQIWFSRLDRSSVPSTTAGQFDVPVVTSLTDHTTEPQLVWHDDGYGLAWLQQPAAGGHHVLMFTLLDPLGQRPDLGPAGAPSLATDAALTTVGVDVQRFHLVWTGAGFRVCWTEIDGTDMLHRQRGIAVPRRASGSRYDAPFQQPSSALIRATLINGATNMRNTPLPNFGNDVNDGYGWGRVNLRQALAPAQPVTFHVRDDATVGPGRTVRYEFRLRRGTRLLRITLAWTDPPGSDLVNHLHLRVTTPAFVPGGVQVLHGNRWRSVAGRNVSDPVPARVPPFEDTHNVQQVVLEAPPDLPEGNYLVDVVCSSLGASAFQQFPGQAFALVFVGSGPELRTAANPGVGAVGIY